MPYEQTPPSSPTYEEMVNAPPDSPDLQEMYEDHVEQMEAENTASQSQMKTPTRKRQPTPPPGQTPQKKSKQNSKKREDSQQGSSTTTAAALAETDPKQGQGEGTTVEATQILATAQLLAKDGIDYSTLKDLLGNTSVNIREHTGCIIISSTYQPTRRGDIIADLAKLYELTNIKLPRLHASLVYLSICLPTLIVKHLETFSPKRIKDISNVSTTRWDLTIKTGKTKKTINLTIPKGEIMYFANKAQHCTKMTREWWTALTAPMKFYLNINQDEWSLNKYNQQLMFNKESMECSEYPKQEDLRNIVKVIQDWSYSYVNTELLTKGKHKEYCAQRLKGLPPSLSKNSQNDSEQPFQFPKFWYFRNQYNKESSDVNNYN